MNPVAHASPRRWMRKVARDRTARVGLVLVTICVAMAVAGPSLAPGDPLAVTADRLQRPGLNHLLGTDGLGRDLLSRLLYGARLSLGTTLLAASLVTLIGLVAGLVAGCAGGLVDQVVMRVVDIVLAIPGLVLALAVAGLFHRGLTAVMLGLVTTWWAGYARIVRGLVLGLREREFVESARAVGASPARIAVRHIVPSLLSPVIVLATLDVGQLLLAVSGLTFLGLGAPPPTPEWGAMLNEGRVYFLSDPHVVLVPGIAISLAVLGFNLLGDGIRDALDPKIQPVRGLLRRTKSIDPRMQEPGPIVLRGR